MNKELFIATVQTAIDKKWLRSIEDQMKVLKCLQKVIWEVDRRRLGDGKFH